MQILKTENLIIKANQQKWPYPNMLESKIQKLKNIFIKGRSSQDDIAEIESWEKSLQKIRLMEDLKKHAGIQMILQDWTSEIVKINYRLNSEKSDTLPDKERDKLLDKREMFNKFISYFSTTNQLESLEKEVDSNLEPYAS